MDTAGEFVEATLVVARCGQAQGLPLRRMPICQRVCTQTLSDKLVLPQCNCGRGVSAVPLRVLTSFVCTHQQYRH